MPCFSTFALDISTLEEVPPAISHFGLVGGVVVGGRVFSDSTWQHGPSICTNNIEHLDMTDYDGPALHRPHT